MDEATTKVDVSVIITTYNIERYVERAVTSALRQDGVMLEVVIVDDCSTDNTWSLVEKMDDPRIKRIRLPKNSGPSVARNTAIAEANGEWLAVLDSDDAFKPGRLARCLKLAREKNAEVVVDNITVHREADGRMFPMFPPARFAQLDRLGLADFIADNTSFFGMRHSFGYLKPVFKTKFLRSRQLQYDPGIRIGEDYALLAEVLASGAMCAVDQTEGYIYTIRSGSISQHMTLEDIKNMAQGNAKFVQRYMLDPQAAAAQRQRNAGIDEVYQFTLLVNAVKEKRVLRILRFVLTRPLLFRHMWRPVWVRITRLLANKPSALLQS